MCPSCEVIIRGGQLSALYELDKKRLGILSLVSKHIKRYETAAQDFL